MRTVTISLSTSIPLSAEDKDKQQQHRHDIYNFRVYYNKLMLAFDNLLCTGNLVSLL